MSIKLHNIRSWFNKLRLNKPGLNYLGFANRKIILLVVVLSSAFAMYGYQSNNQQHYFENKIYTVPQDYIFDKSYPPYTGPHPSQQPRPVDPFTYPIKIGEAGPVKPLFSGPHQYPFICRTEDSGLGQPLVDNQQEVGIKVFQLDANGHKTRKLLGYSKDCLLATRSWYMYKPKNSEEFKPLEQDSENIDSIVLNGQKILFIVRVEVGTIHRHPYVILALKGKTGSLQYPDNRHWNKKLIYQFRGGVGIGKRQGRLSVDNMLNYRQAQLALGYAVVHSTNNQTSNHYNIWLSEDTALRLKRQFVSLYGKPDYTVGIGGSGGGLQQYLLAQNNPDILDAAIPLYSYPDMLTQTPHVLDCELLEHYFDVTDADNPKWQYWQNRQWIEGMNAINDQFNKYTWITATADALSGNIPKLSSGMSECVNAWRGLTPLILNPRFPFITDHIDEALLNKTHLNYWDDLKYIYGTDKHGYAHITWDNEGVQYGLLAVKQQQISIEEFLHLNASIGGWKHPKDMQKEHFWFLVDEISPVDFSVWSAHNMHLSPDQGLTPAKRTRADIKAIEAAYRSGQIFLGKAAIPILDVRHYMEDSLDMHHSVASFSARARIIQHQGHADNHVIWMTRKPHFPVPDAFAAIDRWMSNIKTHPRLPLSMNKPIDLVDSCFNAQGQIIFQGDEVWNGRWNKQLPGACSKIYPAYSSSRIIAGDSIRAEVIKCQRQSIEQAIDRGLYEPIDMSPHMQRLKQIFPQGVCDYSKPDVARPSNLFSRDKPRG